MKDELIQLLTRHEGLRLNPYKCTAGYLTIGIGRNIETRGITKQEAEYLLSNDIDHFTAELNKRVFRFNTLPELAKIVLIDMAFNLGVDGLLKFTKTLSLISEGKYKEASKEMLNSAWAKQVGPRAYELSGMLSSCIAPPTK